MNSPMIKGFLIDPLEKSITQILLQSDQNAIFYHSVLMNIGCIDYNGFSLRNGDMIFVDKEWLNNEHYLAFKIRSFGVPLFGKAVIVGINAYEESFREEGPVMQFDGIKNLVQFYNESETAILRNEQKRKPLLPMVPFHCKPGKKGSSI